MDIGFVGLGKMGGNMALRLVQGSPDGKIKGGHKVVGFAKDPNPELTGVAGITLVDSLQGMISKLQAPRAVWVMVPAGNPTEQVITDLVKLMQPGDLIIDGGNSYYKDSIRREQGLEKNQIAFVDVGTSGGIWGRQEGYCMMVGGKDPAVARIKPILDTLAPVGGWGHVGSAGAGHFTKMVHNGVEYGMMEAYAEGFEVLHKSQYKLDLHKVTALWNRGSVVRSWLLELSERMFAAEGDLSGIAPYVVDSGEGRWTVEAAFEETVPVPVITAALFARYASRDPENFAARYTAGLRNQFGGHAVQRAEHKQLSSSGEVRK